MFMYLGVSHKRQSLVPLDRSEPLVWSARSRLALLVHGRPVTTALAMLTLLQLDFLARDLDRGDRPGTARIAHAPGDRNADRDAGNALARARPRGSEC